MGREGAGPGEYREPYSVAKIAGTLAVLDPRNVRIGLFTAPGGWAGQLPAPPITGGPMVRLYRPPGPRIYLYALVAGTPRPNPAFIGYATVGPPDTLLLPPSENSAPGITCEGSDHGLRFFATPYAAGPFAIPGPDNTLLLGQTGQERFALTSARGDTVRTFQVLVEPPPITPSQWDSATAEYGAYRRADPAATCEPRTFTRPSTKPAFRTAFWSDHGELWVERYTAQGFAFDVFAPDARLVGAFDAPPRDPDVDPSLVSGRLALSVLGQDGFPLVRVYAVPDHRVERR